MGFLSKVFSAKTKVDPVALSVLKTDVHSHLIPGIDDGAKDINHSLELIQGLMDLGYTKLITTPHIMSDYYKNTPEIINRGLDTVREALEKKGISVEIEAAAEYYLDFGFEDLLAANNLLTFGDNYLLFEVSYINPPDNINKLVFDLLTNGYKPVLAHPERYPFWYNDFDQYYQLREKGVLLQMNLTSLTGHYSPATQKIAERMVDEGIIDFVGSDTHHGGHISLIEKCRTTPHLSKLIESGTLLNSTL